jgi:hypothetical protein
MSSQCTGFLAVRAGSSTRLEIARCGRARQPETLATVRVFVNFRRDRTLIMISADEDRTFEMLLAECGIYWICNRFFNVALCLQVGRGDYE